MRYPVTLRQIFLPKSYDAKTTQRTPFGVSVLTAKVSGLWNLKITRAAHATNLFHAAGDFVARSRELPMSADNVLTQQGNESRRGAKSRKSSRTDVPERCQNGGQRNRYPELEGTPMETRSRKPRERPENKNLSGDAAPLTLAGMIRVTNMVLGKEWYIRWNLRQLVSF